MDLHRLDLNLLVALDAHTGRQLWEADRGGDLYATNTTGPIVVNGVVIAGSTPSQFKVIACPPCLRALP